MGERSINAKAVRNTGGEWVPKQLYFCQFTKVEGIGCEFAEIRVPNSGDLPSQLDRLEIYEDLELLWYGRIEDKPEISDTGEVTVTAIGYNSALKDNQITKLWSDKTFVHWDTTPPTEPESTWSWELCDRDNNHRLFFRVPDNATLTTDMISGIYYRLGNVDATDTALHSITFDFTVGDSYDASDAELRISTFTKDFESTADTAAIQSGTGPVGKTSKSFTFTANKTGMHIYLRGQSTTTMSDSQNWARITNVRVNGDSSFTGDYTYKEIIDDLLTNHTTGISTDISLIATGTMNLDTFYIEDMTYIADIISQASAAEDVSMGFYVLDSSGNPQYQAEAINRSTVNWIAFQNEAKLNLSGPSIQDQYNQARVVFNRADADGKRTMTWSVSDFSLTDPFADAGITRTAVLDEPTQSVSKARNIAKGFLTDSIEEKAQGDSQIDHDILNTTRGKVSPVSMNPNEIIQFADVDVSPDTLVSLASSNVLNGKNIFRVSAVAVDAINKSVIATLDIQGDRLDMELGNLI